jgi:hypothetical protein
LGFEVSRLTVTFSVLAAFSCRGPRTDVTLPVGTEIKIRLEQDLSANASLAGEMFEATLAAPLSAEGKLLARAGAPVRGELTEVDEGNARLTMTLRSVEVNGQRHALEAAPLTVEAAGIAPGALFRLPLAKPLELPPQPVQ